MRSTPETLRVRFALHQAWLRGDSGGVRMQGVGLDLQDLDFSAMDLRGVVLINCDLRFADLAGSELTDAQLLNCDLRFADLSNCDLHSVNFTGCEGVNHV